MSCPEIRIDYNGQWSAALFHRGYVEGCLKWYQEQMLTPGNPDDGIWHQAHYPVPKRLGGQATVELLFEHHAVQGVLQSEEFQCCCVSGTFLKPVSGTPYEEKMRWWLGEHVRKANKEPWTQEMREKASQSQLKRFEEQPMTQETKTKMSKARAGMTYAPRTLKHRQNISKSLQRPESKALRREISLESRRKNPENYTDSYVVYDVLTKRTTVYPDRLTCCDNVRLSRSLITQATQELKAVPKVSTKHHIVAKRFLISKLN
jgi:hypothetical protein